MSLSDHMDVLNGIFAAIAKSFVDKGYIVRASITLGEPNNKARQMLSFGKIDRDWTLIFELWVWSEERSIFERQKESPLSSTSVETRLQAVYLLPDLQRALHSAVVAKEKEVIDALAAANLFRMKLEEK